MSGKAPSGLAASLTLARLTLRRLSRDRSTLLTIAIALIPVAFIGLLGGKWQPDNGWSRVLNVTVVPLLAIVPAMVLAPLVAEEASAQTYSYLWSRPLPRWTVVAGKALALGPFVAGLFAISLTLCWLIVWGPSPAESHRLARALLGVVLGTLAAGAVSATFGVFLHKYAVAAAAGYFLTIDLAIGAVPFSVSKLAVTHHIREIAGTGEPGASIFASTLWLLGIAVIAVVVLLLHIRRVELAASAGE